LQLARDRPGRPAQGGPRLSDTNADSKVSLAEYKARIAKLDTDGNASLSVEELPLHHPRGPRGTASDQVPPFVDEADTDQDGELSADELVAVFNTADQDQDGFLLVRGPRAPGGRR
jgi:hypothetical protein